MKIHQAQRIGTPHRRETPAQMRMASLARIALNYFIFCGSFIYLQLQQAGQWGNKWGNGEGGGVPVTLSHLWGFGSKSVLQELRTYPSPNTTTVKLGKGRGRYTVSQVLSDQWFLLPVRLSPFCISNHIRLCNLFSVNQVALSLFSP